ncbi:MAG: methylmalonyl Co-A mutase-associated GTPase MeaB [Pelagibacteraceae bacterium TMED65]|nr:methylmalonyl Co-A mutase-associated GTPase MeaB [Rickettsiales bacterium]OUU51240.1 MAG: methylmalonyl Co-A mutase-associated GTPase MeaB [Pelagibacteraceae bacterium TMED65]
MRLKDYLKFNNISNKEFSLEIGISPVSLSRYINGGRLPEKDILNKIYEATDKLVDANDFYIKNINSEKLSENQKDKVNEIYEKLSLGEKKYLAKAITLVESSLKSHQLEANYLLSLIKENHKSLRIGITGVPGVGKSTFIESFGMKLINLGYKVSVLAVDPSSKRTGGSILGDKTRMMKLSVNDRAFIRPSPSQGHLGGVAKKTSDSILCLEQAGFNIIFVETMGVGQAETSVYDMVDIFIVLLLPSGGDELQGIKKGIIEMADLIIVNKADGNLKKSAYLTMQEYKNAQSLISKSRKDLLPGVLSCSSVEESGLDEIWSFIEKFFNKCKKNKSFYETRKTQKVNAIWRNLNTQIEDYIVNDVKLKNFTKKIIKDVENGKLDVNNAVKLIFNNI